MSMEQSDWLSVEIGKRIQASVGPSIPVFQGMRPTENLPPVVVWWINNSEALDDATMKNVELVVRVWASPEIVESSAARGEARTLSAAVERALHRWSVLLHDPVRFAYAMLARTSRISNRDGDETAARGWESAYIIQTDE